MQTNELREKYLAFFESKGHTRRPSDVLVPRWDPSVLFTPAGMNQFKDHFLGKVKRESIRWAWELLTDKKWFGLDPSRLSVTVYLDDDEAAEIWQKEIGLPIS